jgi:pantetheine-phosphate adenylyltransferase
VTRTAVYGGTFDPVTKGHLDVLGRALRLFDEVVVCVARHGRSTMFTPEERLDLVCRSIADLEGAEARLFEGLLAQRAREWGAVALVRGIRGARDYEAELQMAFANHGLAPGIETVFVAPSAATALISSTLVREVASLGGDVSPWVPPAVQEAIAARRKG